MTDKRELRAKWERFNARLDEGETETGSLLGASFIIARTGVSDVLALLDERDDVLAKCLEAISPCVVGWGDDMPSWAEQLWKCVNPLQEALGIPLTDTKGDPL